MDDSRVEAVKTLHNLLLEKDKNAQLYRDKALKYERAFQEAENRIARLMQLHAGAAAAASLGGAAAGDPGTPTTRPSHPASDSSSSSSSGATLTAATSSSGGSTLVPDSSITRHQQSKMFTDSSPAQNGQNVLRPADQETSVPKDRTQVIHYERTLPGNDVETDGDGPARPAGVRLAPAVQLGVSQIMFDNVVKENLRLKKMLEEGLKTEGSNVHLFLFVMSSNVLLQEKQEYIDVVKQQRAELNMERQKVTEMQRWIVMQKAGERQQLLLQLLEQQNRVQQLTKETQVKSTMVESCVKEVEKLNSQIKALKTKQMGGETEMLKRRAAELQQQLEDERRKHHLQMEELMRNAVVSQPSQRPDNDLESLRSQIGHLEDKLRKENDSKKNLELQLRASDEKQKTASKGAEEQKAKYDKELRISESKTRDLQKQKYRLEQDNMKLRQQVQHYEMLVKRYAPPQFEASGGVPIASCAQEMKEPWQMSTGAQPRSILVHDGPSKSDTKSSKKNPDGSVSTSLKKSASGGARPKSQTSAHSSAEGQFECPRCYRTNFNGVEHFKDHCKKCVQ